MFLIELSSKLCGFYREDAQGFEELMHVQGDVYRDVKGRRTVKFERGGQHYFIKAHQRASIIEWLKSLLSLKWPVLGARPEWLGIEAFNRVDVPTMTIAGKGMRGWIPGSAGSFIVTESFENSISLEELLQRQESFGEPQRNRLKRHLIPKLGELSRRLHEGGRPHPEGVHDLAVQAGHSGLARARVSEKSEVVSDGHLLFLGDRPLRLDRLVKTHRLHLYLASKAAMVE